MRLRRPFSLPAFGILVIALLLGLGGCATPPTTPTSASNGTLIPSAASTRSAPQYSLAHADPRIGTYTSSEDSFHTNSYWIQAPGGLIFVDTQFLLSAAAESIDWAERATGKKVVLAIVLHPNPDKFNGTEVFKKRGIPVMTSDQVLALIPEVHKDRHFWFYNRFKPDYPDQEPMPSSFGPRSLDIAVAGTTLKAHVLGAGASGAHVVVEFEGHVFTGDLVASLGHSWLELGRTDEWLKRIEEISDLEPEFVHPGRGPSGGEELLARQESYLRKVIELVAKQKPSSPASTPKAKAAIERVLSELEALYVEFSNTHFLEIGLPAEWDRQYRARIRVAPPGGARAKKGKSAARH